MATETKERPQQAVAVFHEPRLPYHTAIQERFGVDKSGWKALTEAIYPAAQTADSVVMALSYCKARNLDPFKRPVHIVPMWDSKTRGYVETVWPGIAELRTTAFRTGQYAGCDETEFGPDETVTFTGKTKKKDQWEEIKKTITFPSWARITVYRDVNGRVAKFVGPKVKWIESYATIGASDVPNDMWESRPEGQLEKCAEAAALRKAFPEELGNMLSAEEMEGRRYETMRDVTPAPAEDAPRRQAPPPPSVASPPTAPKEPAEPIERKAPQETSKVEEVEGEILPPAEEKAAPMAMDEDPPAQRESPLPRLLGLMAKAQTEAEADDVYAKDDAAIASLNAGEEAELAAAYEARLSELRGTVELPSLPLPPDDRATWKAECFRILKTAKRGSQIIDWWQSPEHKQLRDKLGIPAADRKEVVGEGERLRKELGE